MPRLNAALLRALDTNANPSNGALIYIYQAGTTTAVTTYADAALTTPQAFPIPANSAGFFPTVYVPQGAYKIVITNIAGVTLDETDDVVISFSAPYYATIQDLLADTRSYGALATGDIIEAGGYRYQVAGSGAADTALTTAGGVGLYALATNGELYARQFNVDPAASAAATRAALQNAIDGALAADVPLVLDFDSDLNTDNTVFLYTRSKLHSRSSGGIVRTTTTPDVNGKVAVLSMGDDITFKTNVEILGDLRIQMSAGLAANTRGSGTRCFDADNLHSSKIEIHCLWAEYVWHGKSNFGIKGRVKGEWCHKGIYLHPEVAGSAGGACTSFDVAVKFDFVIFPFDFKSVVYSSFTGYAEAIKKAYAHYATDETSVIFTLDGCLGLAFTGGGGGSFGVEAVEGMLVYTKGSPSYVDFNVLLDMSSDPEQHFEHDATRISNIPYAEQGIISLQAVGAYNFNSSVLSGSSVTVTTNSTYLFRRVSDQAMVNINGGFIEPGPNYTFANIRQNINGHGNRNYNIYRFLTTDTQINLGNGMAWISVTGLSTNAAGEVTIAPAGVRKILSVELNVVRDIASADHAFSLMTGATATSRTYKSGLGAGFGVTASVLAVLN